jgi:membrane-associated phospholipid phosphatase
VIAVPVIRRSNQGLAMVLGYAAFSAVYLGTGRLHLVPPTLLAPGPIDAAVPFVEWTVWIYLTQFLLLPTAIVAARDDTDRSYALYAMLVATVLAAAIFLAWPTQVARATPGADGLTGLAWGLLHGVDTPANCFPSLHIALAVIAGRALWRRGWVVPALVWPVLITLSTLTTKQHVAWDIAGGLALAVLAIRLTPRILRLERTQLAHDSAGA